MSYYSVAVFSTFPASAAFSAFASAGDSSLLDTTEMEAIASPSLRLIRRTPWVALWATRRSDTAMRIVSPERLMIMRSSLSVTFLMATSFPVFSVISRVLTPFPPLLVMRYSSKSVLLP